MAKIIYFTTAYGTAQDELIEKVWDNEATIAETYAYRLNKKHAIDIIENSTDDEIRQVMGLM